MHGNPMKQLRAYREVCYRELGFVFLLPHVIPCSMVIRNIMLEISLMLSGRK